MQPLLDRAPLDKEDFLTPRLMAEFVPATTKRFAVNGFEAKGARSAKYPLEMIHSAPPSASELISDLPLLEIKLHRPHVTSDLIERPRLYAKLISGQQASLTLVSAPAGYGKTTLLASWLERWDQPGAWLSLDEGDNDLAIFLTYLVAAIRTCFPGACPQIAAALTTSQFSMSWLAATLANELDRLPSRMALVLDDVHTLDNQVVTQFLTILLRYPLKKLGLILVGRKDPFLPLARLRAQGQLNEIRVSDLRFNYEETAAYLGGAVAVDLRPDLIAALEEQTEGWITGLRLASLSISNNEDANALMQRLRHGTRYVMDYLVEEVITRQEPVIREYLLMASLADRFCAPLLDAMSESRALPWNGRSFLEWLGHADLFVVSLDETGTWFRFHFLFKQLLRHLLPTHFGSHEVNSCHLRMSAWYAQQGMIQEALHHALAGGDEIVAIQIVEQHLNGVLNREDAPALAKWLAHFPEHLINRHPVLLVAQGYSLNFRCRNAAVLPCLDRAESLLATEDFSLSARTIHSLRCGINLLRSQDAYWRGEISNCLLWAQQVLAEACAEESFVRGNAMLYLSLARQRLGEGELAIGHLELTLAENYDRQEGYIHWLHLALASLHHFQGDLERVIEIAGHLVASPTAVHHRMILGWAHCQLGAAWYQRNHLDVARHHFAAASQFRNQTHPLAAHCGLRGQALIALAHCALEEADELAYVARELADDSGSPELVVASRALMALIALAHGDVTAAGKLLPSADVGADALVLWNVAPTLIRAKILLADPSQPLLEEADAQLECLIQLAEKANNRQQVIATLVLHSLVLQALQRPRAGLESLRQAIELAEPRGFRRVFLDEGAALIPQLQELARQAVAPTFIKDLLAAMPKAGDAPITPPKAASSPAKLELIEALTCRELDVLDLLVQRLSNQEIADMLFISQATVRTHLTNVYQKFQVGSRRQAVVKAIELGVCKMPA